MNPCSSNLGFCYVPKHSSRCCLVFYSHDVPTHFSSTKGPARAAAAAASSYAKLSTSHDHSNIDQQSEFREYPTVSHDRNAKPNNWSWNDTPTGTNDSCASAAGFASATAAADFAATPSGYAATCHAATTATRHVPAAARHIPAYDTAATFDAAATAAS